MEARLFLAFSLLMTSGLFAGADSTNTVKKIYITQKINPHPPKIDGRLDDPAWEKVEWVGDFTQRTPNDGSPPTQKTTFRILYDANNIYVGIRAHDTEPNKIVSRVTRRDSFEGDWVEINIDSYFDHRTAFSFTINAAGVKGDEFVSLDGDSWDSNWDPVWFAEVNIDNQGWTAEMRIPLSQLRFAQKEEHVWGIQIQRRLYREGERSVWQYIPQNTGGWVSYFGELHGLQGLRTQRRVEVLPYVVGDARRFSAEADNPFVTGRETNFSAGGDVKIGVTSDLTLDAAINPDFGQVEADPSEVNLTAFETFFPEKRPFFIEGQDILDYRLMGGDGTFSNDRIFYSRRVGRSPQYYPELDDNQYADVPEHTSILTAMKLSGKTQSGLSIGILDAVTAREKAVVDTDGDRHTETAEPLSNYFVGRLQKDFNRGNTALGGMFTATNRDVDSPEVDFLSSAAYTGGLDFRHQWDNKTYYLDVKTSFSHIRGSREAMLHAQTASQRYYQRPDADYVKLDSTRTSLTGHGGFISAGRGGNHNLRLNVGVMWRSPGLELNDLGFLRQADRTMQWSWLGYRWTQPFSIFRNLQLNVNQWAGWNFGGETVFTGGNVNGGGELKNFWQFWGGVGIEGSGLSTSELRGGPALKYGPYLNQWYSLSTDGRKSLQFGLNGSNSWAQESDSRRNDVSVWMRMRPMNAIMLQFNPFYSFNLDDLQYISTEDFSGDDRYVFGRLNQKTLGITIRFEYSITPELSIQYYGQPFISSGNYVHFKRITDSRANAYSDRFHIFSSDELAFNEEEGVYEVDENGNGSTDYTFDNPNFDFRQFRSNLVVRWEYRPGSTVFLVWTQERTGLDETGQFEVSNGFDKLFSDASTNVFLIKINRWFSL